MLLKQFSSILTKSSLLGTPFSVAVFSKSVPRKSLITNDKSDYFIVEQQEIKAAQTELSAFNEFKEGTDFEEKGKYGLAIERFKRVLDILEMSPLKGSNSHLYLLRKLVSNQLSEHNYKYAEKLLQSAFDVAKSTKDDARKFAHFNSLLQLYLQTNLDEAISLGNNLLAQNKKNELLPIDQTLLLFNLGTAYLLKENYGKAINTFNKCVELEPDNLLKGYVLNNMALAIWWQKKSEINKGQNKNTNNETLDINPECKEAISLLKDALYYVESPSSESIEKKDLLKELLCGEQLIPKDNMKLEPDNQVLLTRKESLTPLINVVQCLFTLAPEKKKEGTYWAKYAIKSFEKLDPEHIYKILIILASFYGNTKAYIKSEGLFRRSLELLENENTYDKAICLELYGEVLTNVTNRKNEGESLILDAKKIAEKFPYWYKNMPSVCLLKTDF